MRALIMQTQRVRAPRLRTPAPRRTSETAAGDASTALGELDDWRSSLDGSVEGDRESLLTAERSGASLLGGEPAWAGSADVLPYKRGCADLMPSCPRSREHCICWSAVVTCMHALAGLCCLRLCCDSCRVRVLQRWRGRAARA
jgi:hypothetical protein